MIKMKDVVRKDLRDIASRVLLVAEKHACLIEGKLRREKMLDDIVEAIYQSLYNAVRIVFKNMFEDFDENLEDMGEGA